MPRFHLPPDAWRTEAELTGDESRHLSQVLRIRAGETVTVFDGAGRRAEAEVTSVSRDLAGIRLCETHTTPPLRPRIALAQAIPKGKNMDLIVQKSVELGVAEIQPLVTRNTVVQPGGEKSEKWRRTALEACKQCGRDTLPRIAEPLHPDEWWNECRRDNESLKIIASLTPGALPLRDTLRKFPETRSVIILVGPEGDFTPAETAAALDAGFHPVSLGEIVMRVETASLYCISTVRYEYG